MQSKIDVFGTKINAHCQILMPERQILPDTLSKTDALETKIGPLEPIASDNDCITTVVL